MKLGDKTHFADIILAYREELWADQYLCETTWADLSPSGGKLRLA
jgi:hypothetical protein